MAIQLYEYPTPYSNIRLRVAHGPREETLSDELDLVALLVERTYGDLRRPFDLLLPGQHVNEADRVALPDHYVFPADRIGGFDAVQENIDHFLLCHVSVFPFTDVLCFTLFSLL